MPGYVDLMEELNHKFPLSEPQIVGKREPEGFYCLALFGAILRMRNLLLSFDEFKGNELISERNLQDYIGRYQDLRDGRNGNAGKVRILQMMWCLKLN